MKASDILDKNYAKIKEVIDNDEPQNAYDIQQSAFLHAKDALEPLIDAETLNKIKQIAFDEGVTMFDIYRIFGILLRDKILADKAISHTDIDAHDPDIA